MARQVPIGDRRLGYVGVSGGGAARAYNVPTTAPTAVRPFGQEALARAVERLGVPINNELTARVRIAEEKAKRESSAAGVSYALGVEPDDLQLPPGDTIGEEAFRRSALEAASAKVEIKAREDVAALRQQFAGKPQEFQKALVERQQKFLSGLPQELGADAQVVYQRLGAAAYLDVDDERRAFERDQARASLMQLTSQITTSAAQLARGGRYEAAMEELGHLANKMGAAGPVAAGGSGALSLQEIAKQGLDASELIRKNFLEGWVDRTPNKRAALNGLRTGKTGDAVVDGVLAATPPDITDAYARMLEQDIRQQEAEARAEARIARVEAQSRARAVLDDELAAADSGTTAHKDFAATLRGAFGADAEPMIERVERKRRVAAAVTDFSTASPDEIAAAIQTEAPAGDNFADEARDTRPLIEAARKITEQRIKDPAGEVLRSFPAVAAMVTSTDPAEVARGLKESARIQAEVFQLPAGQVQVLPPAMSAKIVQSFKDAPTAEGRLAILSGYTSALGDDALSGRVLKELEAKGLPPEARLALERVDEGEIANARDIVAGIALDPKDLPNLGEATTDQIRTAIDARMAADGPAGITARLASMSRQPGLFARVAAERNTMERLAREAVAAGADADTAVMQAEKTLYGGRDVAGSEDLGYVRAPQGIDAGEFTGALDRARQAVDLSYLAPQPGPTADGAAEGERLAAMRDFAGWAQAMRDGAMWAETKGGYILLSPAGEAVSDPNAPGRPRVFTSQEILALGARADAAGRSPAPAGQTQRLGLPGELPADPWAQMQPQGGANANDGLSGGGGTDRLTDSPSGFSMVPVNMKTFVRAMISPGATPRREDFADSDVAAIKQAVGAQVAEGKTSGVIGYGDYAKGGIKTSYGDGPLDIIAKSLFDPAYRAETTIGMAKWKLDENGDVVVSDSYTFDANDKVMKKALAERGGFQMILDGYARSGMMGVLNTLGNLRVGTEDKKKERRYSINFGKLKD